MFARFKIEKDVITRNIQRVAIFKDWDSEVANVKEQLSEIIKGNNGVIDGDALKSWSFPLKFKKEYHIFISHSHADEEAAKSLAAHIEQKYHLNCFIDSLVWKNAFDILKEIDNLYCQNSNNRYDYDKRNYTTAHVYAMLSLSLMEMIQKTECCILIGNGDSINLNNVKEGSTISPWVYEEICYMNNLPKRNPRELPERREFSDNRLNEAQLFRIKYTANLHKFKSLTWEDLNIEADKTQWLDRLYVHHNLIINQL